MTTVHYEGAVYQLNHNYMVPLSYTWLMVDPNIIIGKCEPGDGGAHL